MLFGLVGHDNWPMKRPPPLFFNVPIKAPVAVTWTRRVAVDSVLVASTRNHLLERWYSAR
jgi:hypothetical protein